MQDFDENPLDILDGDGDDAVEMSLLFDEDSKDKGGGNKPSGNSGCCVLLLGVGASIVAGLYGVAKLIT